MKKIELSAIDKEEITKLENLQVKDYRIAILIKGN